MHAATPHLPAPDPAILARNLAALARRSPDAARAIAQAPNLDLRLVMTPEGTLGGGDSPDLPPDGADHARASAPPGAPVLALELPEGFGESFALATGAPAPRPRLLASRVAPRREGAILAGDVDVASVATVVVLGFALGYHAEALASRLRETGLVIAFEPDAALLRAVLSRIDHSAWLGKGNVLVLTGDVDRARLATAIAGAETLLGLGTKILAHPASRRRLGERADRFAEDFAHVMKAVRTHLVTTLVQVETTLRNLLQNAGTYAQAPGVADLAGRCAGRPAILVAAGPSLARTIDLLARPGVRERFVIVAVQTALKPLLAKGIKPHFVTALDYHEISTRFYEGLTPDMVRGVTLVAEPKANPAILDAFPGVVRCPGDHVLDDLLGPSFARDMGALRPGATVAHLAYYLARHLGCDPVILVGQDLGFTDGQYYGANAAIHNVWAGELNEFNTLEMLEWQRIARMKSLLRRGTDVLGRPIYTDEQMATYLVQFERDFALDAAQGRTTIDATGGGVQKRHATPMPLEDALSRLGVEAPGTPPDPIHDHPPSREGARARREALAAHLRSVRADTLSIADASRQAAGHLARMLESHADQRRVNDLIAKVYALRDQVTSKARAYALVHYINQTGTFRRLRADRALAMAEALSPLDKQRRQIERDRDNVLWLADAADQAGRHVDDALRVLAGGAKVTRDALADAPADPGEPSSTRAPRPRHKVLAVVLHDTLRDALGVARDGPAVFLGRPALAWTLERLARAKSLDAIAVATTDPDAARREIAQAKLAGVPIAIEPVPPDLADVLAAHRRAIGAARLWSRECWRGGIANACVADEACPPALLARVLERHHADAAVILAHDWVLIDPLLVDACVQRTREAPDRQKLVFTQAAPGLAPFVVHKDVLAELAAHSGPHATLAGLLAYIPIAPQADPIAKPCCVRVETVVRDAQRRFILDAGDDSLERLIRAARLDPAGALADAIARAAIELQAQASLDPLPRILAIDAFARPSDPRHPAAPLDPRALRDMLLEPARLGELRSLGVTLAAGPRAGPASDPLDHPRVGALVAVLRELGVAAVHVRTRLTHDPVVVDRLLAAAPDVISVDCVAWDEGVYRALTGRDDLARVRANLDQLAASRASSPARLPLPWIVPRITRRDEVYDQIEGFYDACLMRVGACVIDPLDQPIPGARIEPLPIPSNARDRARRSTARLDADGVLWRDDATPAGHVARGLANAWAARPPAQVEHRPAATTTRNAP